ncbi:MAG: FAD-binding oxidoreductase, partial [Planctomycetes bacterium]|nr:FAD-binding oxidoreductase [Planctomycetota bacterium]
MTTNALPLTETHTPDDIDELVDVVRNCCASKNPVYPIGGAMSLDYGRTPQRPGVGLSLSRLNRIIDYPARDMTITVEPGITIAELRKTLAGERQELPVDVPQAGEATIGGVVATALAGPRCYGLGTIRDYVIGISAVDGRGTLFKGGGRVVKNVAGLDMAKIQIGSFGTLAAIATVNFKVLPQPVTTRSFVFSGDDLSIVLKVRRRILASQLQPVAVDLLTKDDLYRLVAESHGGEATVARYESNYKEFANAAGADLEVLSNSAEAQLWNEVREFSSRWMAAHPDGGVLRVSSPPADLGIVVELCENAS